MNEMLADYHMHINYSNDSTYEMEGAVLKTIDLGLDEICITEHNGYGTMDDYIVDYGAYHHVF